MIFLSCCKTFKDYLDDTIIMPKRGIDKDAARKATEVFKFMIRQWWQYCPYCGKKLRWKK